jgi:hypothetical protein
MYDTPKIGAGVHWQAQFGMVSTNTVNPIVELPRGIVVDVQSNIVTLSRQLKFPTPLVCVANITVGVAHSHPGYIPKVTITVLVAFVILNREVTLTAWIGMAKENDDGGLNDVET